MVEEYFYSADTGRQLEQKLIDAGFKNVGGSEYHIERALVLVQKIRSSDPVNDTCRLLPDDAPTEDWFLLGLYKLLSDFPKDSPLRKFFRSLAEPVAFGIGTPGSPVYHIEEYF